MYQHRTSSRTLFYLLALGAACNPTEDGPGTADDTTGAAASETSAEESGGFTTGGSSTSAGTTEDEATAGSSTSDGSSASTSSGTDTETGTSTSGGSGGGTGGEPPTPCSRLGGLDGSAALAQAVRARVLADDRINAYFLNADLDAARLWSCMGDLIATMVSCEGAAYTCADMPTAHAGLGISALDFADFVEDFTQALVAFPNETTAEDRAALVAAVAAMGGDIVADPGNDATVYQRVGRKPRIAKFVGSPDKPGSFLGRIAGNTAINGFFGAADFARLGTCLTRQFAGLDGPARYGLEVDAPDGVDPGVGLESPCRDMATAHAGVVDADQGGITFADFGVVVAELHHALDTYNIAPADRDALLAAMDPLCADIVAAPEKPACPGFYQTEVLAAPGIYAFVPDDAYDGTIESMRCHAFEVAEDDADVITGAELTIGISHAFIGDLVIKVQSPDLEVLTVLNRPGYAEPTDSGLGGPGDGSALLGFVPIRFADDAPFIAELMGSKLPAKKAVCLADLECDFHPSPGMGPGSNFAGFKGHKAAGTWQVCVGDAGEGHVGNVNSIVLTLEQQMYWP